jgi:peptidoglycan hydrolase-like protein with peptidoglycan-binding domain
MLVWDAVGHTGSRAAKGPCSASSFTGGARVLTQWTTTHQDFDLTCPGVTGHTPSPLPLAAYRKTTLRIGSRGWAVDEVQRRVGARSDGAFGPQTRARITAFQRSPT